MIQHAIYSYLFSIKISIATKCVVLGLILQGVSIDRKLNLQINLQFHKIFGNTLQNMIFKRHIFCFELLSWSTILFASMYTTRHKKQHSKTICRQRIFFDKNLKNRHRPFIDWGLVTSFLNWLRAMLGFLEPGIVLGTRE